MPRNKDALIRYRVINRCLIDYKICSKEKLKQACEDALDKHPLGERTIAGDIHDMRHDEGLGYDAPIKFDKHEGGYYYDDPDYSIDKIPLNQEELETLGFVSTLLRQFRDVDIFSQFSGAIQKIIDAINVRKLKDEKSDYPFIDFEKVPFQKGSEFLQPLIEAIKNKEAITITYQPFYVEDPYATDIHPYLLKEYRNRWYAIGLNDKHKELRTYGLDRICNIDICTKKYIDSGFDPEEYFKNSIGIISPSTNPPTIKIAVKKQQAQYLITQPLHTSQKVLKEDEEQVIFELKVHPTYEMKSIFLSYGSDLRVLEPKELREEFVSILKESLENY
jgi:predicted DNA-binding transcriptional regulator YafY